MVGWGDHRATTAASPTAAAPPVRCGTARPRCPPDPDSPAHPAARSMLAGWAGCCNVRNYMPSKTRRERIELKVVRIGNSRGVRLLKEVLARYRIREAVVLEVREEGLLLRG